MIIFSVIVVLIDLIYAYLIFKDAMKTKNDVTRAANVVTVILFISNVILIMCGATN